MSPISILQLLYSMIAKEELVQLIRDDLCDDTSDDWDSGWNAALEYVLELLGEEISKGENYN